MEKKGHSDLRSPRKQAGRRKVRQRWAIFGRRKKAILNRGDLDGKGGFVVRELFLLPFLIFFPREGDLGFCWEKPNWGRTGDEKGFLLESGGRGLGKKYQVQIWVPYVGGKRMFRRRPGS